MVDSHAVERHEQLAPVDPGIFGEGVDDKAKEFNSRQLDELASFFAVHLQDERILPEGSIDWSLFHLFRRMVYETSYVPQTSITGITSRLLFAIGVLFKPRSLVGIGTYYGNAICWVAAAGFSKIASYRGLQSVAVDLGYDATIGFKNYCHKAGLRIQGVCGDGVEWLEESNSPIDLLYLDLDLGAPKVELRPRSSAKLNCENYGNETSSNRYAAQSGLPLARV